MDNVSVFVKTIISITFMWCIAESVIPDNSMQKYSSFIYGLVIISLTVSVFAKLDYNSFFIHSNNVETAQYADDYLKTIYEDKINNALSEKFGDNSIRVELTDEYKIKNIHCKNKKTYDDVMRYLNE